MVSDDPGPASAIVEAPAIASREQKVCRRMCSAPVSFSLAFLCSRRIHFKYARRGRRNLEHAARMRSI